MNKREWIGINGNWIVRVFVFVSIVAIIKFTVMLFVDLF